MDAHIYKKIEIVGTSEVSSDDAVQNAIARCSSSIKNLRWLELIESRGTIKDGKNERWQVTIKIGFNYITKIFLVVFKHCNKIVIICPFS